MARNNLNCALAYKGFAAFTPFSLGTRDLRARNSGLSTPKLTTLRPEPIHQRGKLSREFILRFLVTDFQKIKLSRSDCCSAQSKDPPRPTHSYLGESSPGKDSSTDLSPANCLSLIRRMCVYRARKLSFSRMFWPWALEPRDTRNAEEGEELVAEDRAPKLLGSAVMPQPRQTLPWVCAHRLFLLSVGWRQTRSDWCLKDQNYPQGPLDSSNLLLLSRSILIQNFNAAFSEPLFGERQGGGCIR